MNIRIHLALGLSLAAMPAFAQDASPLPAVEVTGYVADCARPVLPSQRQVGEWTGLHNFGQVYDARERLMGDIARACRQPGIAHVRVAVQGEAATNDRRFVAMALRAAR
jgi:hypothetical protein